jgi:hypothetical protein
MTGFVFMVFSLAVLKAALDQVGEASRSRLDPSDGRQLPRIAIEAPQELRGLVVADDLLGAGVSSQGLAAQPHGDVAEMADRDRPVGDLDRRGGRPARDHAIDEVEETLP